MKISKSKQELARIISENGGWRDGAKWATQDHVIAFFSGGKPYYAVGYKVWRANGDDGVFIVAMSAGDKINGFNNTILSRAEYFHLYPAPEQSLGELCDKVTEENKHEHVDAKPTIEQLSSDYRNAKDYAERKQQEAGAAKADAEAKLADLIAAGNALGLVLRVEREGGAATPIHSPLIAGD